jgi:uncharacterized protein YukE
MVMKIEAAGRPAQPHTAHQRGSAAEHPTTLSQAQTRAPQLRGLEIQCKFSSSNESFLSSDPHAGGREMAKGRSVADLHNCEQAVIAAARKERAARAALRKGIKPRQPSWTEWDEQGYEARLAHWQAASRALVDALNRLRRTGERVSP